MLVVMLEANMAKHCKHKTLKEILVRQIILLRMSKHMETQHFVRSLKEE